MKRERWTEGANPQPVSMARNPPVFVSDDPARFLDPKRHPWRANADDPLYGCAACGKRRELHAEANEGGKRRKVG